MIELIDFSEDMFDFILESNNINKPQVGYLHKERLELLTNLTSHPKSNVEISQIDLNKNLKNKIKNKIISEESY